MKKGKIVALTIVCLVFLAGCTQNTAKSNQLLEQAKNELEQLDYALSLSTSKKAINEDPANIEAYTLANQILTSKKSYVDNIELMKIGLNYVTTENKNKIKLFIAESNFLNKSYAEAEDYFKQVWSTDKNNSASFTGLILSLAYQNKFQDAKNIVDSTNSNLNFEAEKIKIYVFSDDLSKAMNIYDKLNQENKDKLTELKEMLDNSSESIEEQILNKMKIAQFIINDQRSILAKPIVTKIVEDKPNYEGGYLYKGIIDYVSNDYDSAEENFKKALSINSKLSDGFRFLALTQTAKKMFDAAQINFDLALKNTPNNLKTLEDNLLMTFLAKKNTKSIELAEAIHKIEDNLENKFQLARIYCVTETKDAKFKTLMTDIDKIEKNDKSKDIEKALNVCNRFLLNEDYNEILTSIKSPTEDIMYVKYLIGGKTEDLKQQVLNSDVEGFYSRYV